MIKILELTLKQNIIEVPTHLAIKVAEKLIRNGKSVTINKSENEGMEIIKVLNHM